MKQYSILSFNFNNYECLREPKYIDDECEYVYVTDDKNAKSKNWDIVYTDKFKDNSPAFASFYVRYHPFEFIHSNTAIIIDGSIQILSSLNTIYNQFNSGGYDICIMLASYYNDTYSRGINSWRGNSKAYNFDVSTIDKFLQFCKFYNVLNEYGIIESGFKILKKCDTIKSLNDEIWNTCLFLKGTDDIFRVDQYVYSIILSKKYSDKLKILKTGRDIIQSKWMQYCKHKTNIPIYEKSNKQMWYNNKLVMDEIKYG